MGQRFKHITTRRFWWPLSALLIVLMVAGSFGVQHYVLTLPYFTAPGSESRKLIKAEISLRKEITSLRTRVTREKRSCLQVRCGSGSGAEKSASSRRSQPPEQQPVPTAQQALVFVLDSSETMGLHVNMGPKVENNLLEGLRKNSPKARQQLQAYLDRTTDRRLDRAKSALTGMLAKIPADTAVGLVSTKDCGQTNRVPATRSRGEITSGIQAAAYSGKKPLATAFRQALTQLGGKPQNSTLVVIADGADTCGKDLCNEVKALDRNSAPGAVHLVNMGRTEPFRCVSKAAFGTVHQPMGPKGMEKVLDSIVATTFGP